MNCAVPQAADRDDAQEPAASPPAVIEVAIRRRRIPARILRRSGDPRADKDVRRVLLCSGKVYYDLAAHREDRAR